MTTAAPLHVYGLVEASSPPLRDLRGRHGASVRRVELGGVAALVSELEAGRRLARADLLAHAHVLEQVADQQSVLPMRFGMQAESEAELRRRVHGKERWAELLRHFAPLVQVTVDAAHHEDDALREVVRRDPGLRALRDESGEEPRDHARMLALGEAVAAALAELRAEDAATLLDHLGAYAQEVADETPPGLVLRAAFLVERRRRRAFGEAVAGAQHALPRLAIRYLGPQPPWAFLGEAMAEGPWDS